MSTGSVITRSAHPSALWPGVYAWFGLKYDETLSQYKEIFEIKSSDKWQERIVEESSTGFAPEKREGESITYDTITEGFTALFTHVVYGLGYIVTREELEDCQYTELSMARAAKLARSMNKTADIVHANHLNRQQNAAFPGGDGVALVSAAHPTEDGTQTNLITAADLSEASLETGLNLMFKATDTRGLKIDIRATQLIISNQNMFNATRILDTQLQPGTDNNDVNAIKMMGSIPRLLYNDFLDDDDAWFIQTDIDQGLCSFERRAVELEKHEDFDTQNAKTLATHRYASQWADWRCIYGNLGA